MPFDIITFIENDFIIIIFFGLIITLFTTILIAVLNEEIEKIATYHTREKYVKRCKNILGSYFKMSLFVFIPIYITLFFYGINPGLALLFSQVGTVEFLVMMRILLNPTWDYPFVKPKFNENLVCIVKNFKERILSLFFSFISITWVISILFYISFMMNSNFNDRSRFVPSDLDGVSLLALIISFIGSLVVFTLLTEFFLSKGIPVDQTLECEK